jgi:hypothetical protein
MKYLTGLLLFLTLSLSAPANDERPTTYPIYSQSCVMGVCTQQQGTGVLLRIRKGHVWLLTAGHILANNPQVRLGSHNYPVSVVQKWRTGNIIPDTIALLRTTEPVPRLKLTSYPLPEKRKPREGDRVWLIGFPRGRPVIWRSHITEVHSGQFLTRHHLSSGASGGAVVYQDTSELAGIIHGFTTRTSEGISSRSDWVRTKLEDEFDYLLPPPRPPPQAPVEAPEPPPKPLPPPPATPSLEPRVEALERDVEEIKALLKPLSTLPEDLQAVKEDLIIHQNDGHQKLQNELREEREQILESFGVSLAQGLLQTIEEKNLILEKKIDDISSSPRDTNVQPEPPPPSLPPISQGDGGLVSQEPSFPSLLGDKVPWMGILAGLGLVGSGGLTGLLLAWAGRRLFKRVTTPSTPCPQSRKENIDAGPPPPVFRRDTTEAEQILSLRQSEQREPLQDALHGVLWEDELKSNPSQTLEEANQSVLDRFNKIFPLSTTEVTPE